MWRAEVEFRKPNWKSFSPAPFNNLRPTLVIDPHFSETTLPYVSITGLELKSPFYAPAFWWHAVRSMRQAYAATGLISAQARKIGGVHHTLTLWDNEAAMRAYLVTGAHLGAMKAFHKLATGRTIGFDCETPPTWEQVPELWAAKGNIVKPRATS
jgi:hypothetical protein